MAPPQGERGGGHLPQILHAGSAIGYNYYGVYYVMVDLTRLSSTFIRDIILICKVEELGIMDNHIIEVYREL